MPRPCIDCWLAAATDNGDSNDKNPGLKVKLIVVSGMSGAGKSTALDMLEDLGYYTINNIPLSLLRTVTADVLREQDSHFDMLAVGIDSRTRAADMRIFPERIEELRSKGVDIQVVYLDASTEVLLRRYSETRRKHPITDEKTPLLEAIEKERRLLQPIAKIADVVLDTSHTNIHELREMTRTKLTAMEQRGLSVLFQSFGFKYGLPSSVDFVFDVRCLPNPHWDDKLRHLTGQDREVRSYLESQPEVTKMRDDIRDFLADWLPKFQSENRAYVTVAIGCTGGKHRSVYLASWLAEHFKDQYPQVLVRHTEIA